MRLGLPSPYCEFAHTADVGVAVQGGDPAETYARAALALAQLLAGGGEVEAAEERPLEAHGADRAELLVDFLRQALGMFHVEHRLLAAVDVAPPQGDALRARAWFGPYDPERHAEGMDVKAVTYARAAVEPLPDGGWQATFVVDV